MKVMECQTYEELSQKAARITADTIKEKPDAVLGLATGGTPEGTYRELIRLHQTENLSFQNVTTVNLDEYAGLSSDDPNSYHFYMNDRFFSISTASLAGILFRMEMQTIWRPNADGMNS